MTESAHMYEQIASSLRDQILSGDIRPGDRLPTQESISDTFGVSRIVARHALDILEAEGLVDRVRGGGTFARRHQPLVRRSALHYRTSPGMPFAAEASAAEKDPRFTYHTRAESASADIANRLGIDFGDEVMHTTYVSLVDDEPAMIVHSYEPTAITRGTAIERAEEGEFAGAGVVDRFTAIDLRPTAVVERLCSRMPQPAEAGQLHLKPGTPVVIIIRTTYANATPLETADLLLSSNVYELEYSLTVEPLPAVTDPRGH